VPKIGYEKAEEQQGERRVKDTVHHPVHLLVHLTNRGSVRTRRTCELRNGKFGRGQDRVLGWNDPAFWKAPRPNRVAGSFQPTFALER